MNIIAAIIVDIINRKFLGGQTRPDFAQIIEQNRGHNHDHNLSIIAMIDCTYCLNLNVLLLHEKV